MERCLACEAESEACGRGEDDWQRVGAACSSYPARAGADGIRLRQAYGATGSMGLMRLMGVGRP
jgi:hypothetical protein